MSGIYLLQYRHGNSQTWTQKNPILDVGEPGYETDTGKVKIGDGFTFWNKLKYQPNESSIAVQIREALVNAEPLSPNDIAQITIEVTTQVSDQVSERFLQELDLPDLVLLWQNSKA